MSDEERTVDAGDGARERATGDRGDESAADDRGDESRSQSTSAEHDEAAESFLELDAALDLDGSDSGEYRRGLVVDADRLDAAAVPAGYPLSPDADEVVALTVDTGERETTVYLAWPGADADVPLVWLLEAMGIELGELYGREVLLDRVAGHDVLVTPDERPRGSGNWQVGVLGGLGLVAAFLALLLGTGGVPPVVGLLWALVTLAGLPYATYRDAWYVRTHSDWDGGPLFWAALLALPYLNLLFGLVYLWQRSRATFFGDDPSLRTRLLRTLRSLT